MKEYDPFLIAEGVSCATKWMREQGFEDVKAAERTTIGNQGSIRVGIYVIPRDHSNDPNELAMIHRDKDYQAANLFFSKGNIQKKYILLSRTYRQMTTYVPEHSNFMLIPDQALKQIYQKQVTLNIGTSLRQKSKWKKPEYGVIFMPFFN